MQPKFNSTELYEFFLQNQLPTQPNELRKLLDMPQSEIYTLEYDSQEAVPETTSQYVFAQNEPSVYAARASPFNTTPMFPSIQNTLR